MFEPERDSGHDVTICRWGEAAKLGAGTQVEVDPAGILSLSLRSIVIIIIAGIAWSRIDPLPYRIQCINGTGANEKHPPSQFQNRNTTCLSPEILIRRATPPLLPSCPCA